jgi:hypothetical protein
MEGSINFTDFYQKPLIPIGVNDSLLDQMASSFGHSTHWLIVLTGSQKEKGSDWYHWRVVVFPSDSLGCVNYSVPYFVSPFIELFNDAYEYAKQLETMAFQDQLVSVAN